MPNPSPKIPLVLPKNSIRRLYQPTGLTSKWVARETMATKKHPSRIRLFRRYTQTGSNGPARQTDVYDQAAREYR